MFTNRKDIWLTAEIYLQWLLDNDIFGLFFGETLHSELVVKYSAVLSFLYSKDQLNEKHIELIWDCAINKHDAYRVNILKSLSTLALQMKPSHSKFVFDKIKNMELQEYCKFTLQVLKHINKNACRGPVSEQAAHEAAFGKEKKVYNPRQGGADDFGVLNTKNVNKKTRSFSLGGDEKNDPPAGKKRTNSPVASNRMKSLGLDTDLLGLNKKPKLSREADDFLPLYSKMSNSSFPEKRKKKKTEETKDEEMKEPALPKVEDDRQSTDEEDKNKPGSN